MFFSQSERGMRYREYGIGLDGVSGRYKVYGQEVRMILFNTVPYTSYHIPYTC